MNYQMTEEEKQFLKQYDITKYDQPSVTVDIAVFAVTPGRESETDRDYRKETPLELSLLLIRRGGYPYKDWWALPGGFTHPGDSLEECARRELCEETSVSNAYLRPFGTFSESGRDPRGWIISNGFLALVDAKDYRIRGGTDAWDARWFRGRVSDQEILKKVEGTNARIRTLHHLDLENDQLKIRLQADVEEERVFSQHHEEVSYRILSREGIAFDHSKIILRAFAVLRQETERDGKIVFDLMPEKFTLYQLQEVHEIILDRKLITPNFRRKIAPFVTETDESAAGAGHRPAKLFRRNLEAFYGSADKSALS